MFGATILMWLMYNPFVYFPKGTGICGWEPGAHLAALYEVETLIPPDACVVASNNIEPHYSTRPETYVLGGASR